MTMAVDELRARARAAGFPVGSMAAAGRLSGERAALARLRAAARRKGELVEPEPIEVEGVVWRVVAATSPPAALALAADLGEIGFRVYCPLARRVVLQARLGGGRRGRRVDVVPLLGEYLFCGERGVALTRAAHPKIVGILSDASGKLAVLPAAIAAISAAECAGRFDETRHAARRPPFAPGSAVRLVDGPFAEFAAVVEAVERSGRIRIAASVFGRVTSIRVDAEHLALVAAA